MATNFLPLFFYYTSKAERKELSCFLSSWKKNNFYVLLPVCTWKHWRSLANLTFIGSSPSHPCCLSQPSMESCTHSCQLGRLTEVSWAIEPVRPSVWNGGRVYCTALREHTTDNLTWWDLACDDLPCSPLTKAVVGCQRSYCIILWCWYHVNHNTLGKETELIVSLPSPYYQHILTAVTTTAHHQYCHVSATTLHLLAPRFYEDVGGS